MSLARAYRDTVLVFHGSLVGEEETFRKRNTLKSKAELRAADALVIGKKVQN